jgi:aminopeptidase N
LSLRPPGLSRELAAAKVRAALDPLAVTAPPTANQLAFDVTAYDLDLAPDLAALVLRGSVRVRARVVQGPLMSMDLDFAGAMVVDSVKVAGAGAAFTRAGDLMTVDLGRAWLVGEAPDLTVWYHGTPPSGAFGSVFAFTSKNGRPLLWTLSEPYGARSWWPCKDHPEDKADSVSVRVTVPSGMKTVCNGRLVESGDDGSVAVTRWVEHHPIATYLVSLASYAYATPIDWYRPTPTDSMPIRFYFYPEDTAAAATVSARVKDMIGAYAARFGEYPFLDEKYGEAEFTWGGGMENQTITSLINPWSEFLAVHELAHEWWGDWVTCREFHHVWLNEGFATYGEALWDEAQSGAAAYHSNLAGNRYLGAGTIYVPDESNVSRMFDPNLSYDKGSWVLHMLRHVLGDGPFFASLKAYGLTHAFGTATTEDFRDACEQVSGRDLDRYFQEWIYGEYYPQYGYRWQSAAAGGGWDVTVTLEQLQSWQLFWMPVDVVIQTADGPQTFVAHDSLQAQDFTFHVAQTPESVQIDPDEWILRTAGVLGVAPGGERAFDFLPPRPDPARERATFAFVLPVAGEARLEIFDVRGARVRALDAGALAAGPHELAWDTRDAVGSRVAPGLYLVRLTALGHIRTQRIAVIR